MSLARTAIVVGLIVAALALTPLARAVSPILSQGAFVFTGWHYGYSAFGTGHF